MDSSPQALNPGLFADLEARGLIKQVTDPELAATLSREPLTVYAGFDPTGDSLHVGHMLPLLTLRRFQLAGHRVIAVGGGATGMIGDPSFKAQERSLLTYDRIEANLAGIQKQLARFLILDGPNPAQILNNADWFKGMTFLDFLRDVGKHFTINHMMAKESVRARLEDREHGISFTEFSYMLVQAYDFYILNQKQGCRLQIGGSDQWGNITAGIELIRRARAAHGAAQPNHPIAQREVYGLTQPLISKADGTKFGKTEQGSVWLDPNKTSPYQFYQFFLQTPDSEVGHYLRVFTFLELTEIERLETQVVTAPEKREAQAALAAEMTRLAHGDEALQRSLRATQALFGSEIRELDIQTLLEVFAGAPSTERSADLLGSGLPLADLLVESGLCGSKGAARKDIAAGGIYVNNGRITDPATLIQAQDLVAGAYVVLRKGKKTYHLVSFRRTGV